MKFTCNTKDLAIACEKARSAVSTKVVAPSIEGYLIEAKEDGKIVITGYDFEIAVITSLEGNIEKAGAIIANAKLLSEIISKVASEEIVLETEKDSLKITGGTSKYKINGINEEDYPILPEFPTETPLSLPTEVLFSMIKKTLFCVSDSETSKPVLTGLSFKVSKNLIETIGVDGYRFAVASSEIEYDGEPLEFVIPKKTLRELVKFLKNTEEESISIVLNPRHVMFSVSGDTILSRLIDGEIFDFKSAIPKKFASEITLNTDNAISCIDKTLPIVEVAEKTPVKCEFGKDTLKVSTASAIGSVNNEVDIKNTGEDVTVGYNSKFLLEALKNAECEELSVNIAGSTAPTVIKPNDGSFIFVVLPMRLRGEQ